MRIFQDQRKLSPHHIHREHTLVVVPAALTPAASHDSNWNDAKGQPVQFTINFVDGSAEVPDHLGKFLISEGYVLKSRPLLRAFG